MSDKDFNAILTPLVNVQWEIVFGNFLSVLNLFIFNNISLLYIIRQENCINIINKQAILFIIRDTSFLPILEGVEFCLIFSEHKAVVGILE